MSVLLTGSDSVSAYLRLGRQREDMENYANVRVRFDQGDAATVCGYPMAWGVWDVNVDYYDYDSPTYAEMEEKPEFYVDEEIEIKLLKACIRGIRRQCKDPMFIDSCSAEYREHCILKIKKRIEQLS